MDYVFGVEVPKLTSEPAATQAGGTDGKGYVLTSIQHSATDTSLVDQTDTEASSRLFVGNLTLNSQASVPATAHVAISLGDGKAIEAAGDDYGIGEWSDPAQPDGGTNMSPWTVTHSSNGGNRANPETFDCSELTQWASARGDAARRTLRPSRRCSTSSGTGPPILGPTSSTKMWSYPLSKRTTVCCSPLSKTMVCCCLRSRRMMRLCSRQLRW